jgi:hypothetical protein
MTLEKTDVIDIVLKPQNGKLTFIIADAGTTPDPPSRYNLRLQTLRTYVGCVTSAGFATEYPGIKPTDVTIRVVCAVPPTEEMQQILNVGPSGDRVNRIAVEFEVFAPDQR